MGVTRMIGFYYAQGMGDDYGIPTTGADTNMTQAGQLGTPLQYDLAKVGIHPFGAGPEYKQRWEAFLNYQPEFVWIFGGNTHWLRTTVNMMHEEFPFMTASEVEQARQRDHEFPINLRRVAETMILPRLVDMTTPEGRMRRIDSTESFRCEVNFTQRAWSEQFEFKFYAAMHGVLYTML